MNRRPCFLVALGAAALVGWAASAVAQTCELKLNRIGSPDEVVDPLARLLTNIYQWNSSNRLFMQIAEHGVQKTEADREFAQIVKKEPKYASAHPFRGVIQLGSNRYALAFDAKDAKSTAYCRLYFDSNHNGDLTDDKVVEGKLQSVAASFSNCQFPRVDLTIDVSGVKVEYSLSISLYTQMAGDFKYASASITPAVYREGQITLEGKQRKVILLDLNGNGRFDDEFAMQENAIGPNGQIFPKVGDAMILDPQPDKVNTFTQYTDYAGSLPTKLNYIAKATTIDGRFYSLKVSPAGDKLTIVPLSAPMGLVASPHEGFKASFYSEAGLATIHCDKSKQATLPEGKWRLLAYTIDQTGWKEPPAKPAAKKDDKKKESGSKTEHEGSLLGALFSAVAGVGSQAVQVGPRLTTVSASATRQCPTITVRKGQTVQLPFGPPYKPIVSAYPAGTDTAQLQLSLTGAAGENCTDIQVNGERPAAPKFTITKGQDEVVLQGVFKYG